MPDLTAEVAWCCESVRSFSTQVRGSKGDIYTVSLGPAGPNAEFQYEWSCTCIGNRKYGKKCKHIEAAKRLRWCGWNAEMDPNHRPHTKEDQKVCPWCDGPVFAIKVAV